MGETARVRLWGSDIGAVTWLPDRGIGVFQYTPEFANSGIEVSPLMMPLRDTPYEFPSLSYKTFKGLPGMLVDSLPDKFGNELINSWLALQGREPDSLTSVERLCHTGKRGIGALEFHPSIKDIFGNSRKIDIDQLVSLANKALDDRIALEGRFKGVEDQNAIQNILRVGSSAGGARAKAQLAWNPQTGEFRSGELPADEGFSHWLMKFDGISNNRDKELADPQGFGRIEYAYHLMACDAGIEMTECRLHEEGGRAHFMTRRFDRTSAGKKLHMQSFGALMHFDFNDAGSYGYEQVLQAIKRLGLSRNDLEQQVRRTFFNILARNQDDHVKNIAFLMDQSGTWSLSPAFDVVYSYNPSGDWTSRHQMSISGKLDRFKTENLITFAGVGGIKKKKAQVILNEVSTAVSNWRNFASEADISQTDVNRIENAHRHKLFT
ncbi:MAG: type II toxin-antitoxin system HipA family toxin [Rhodobacteraceae bacterium]|nr:type II toxin-antitoxin system HipA family toxin [Paracoccaceae bacterium]MCY4251624.1 type II toxin-antitoxin system HipA family toxin [Paracoccaceae bacterium]